MEKDVTVSRLMDFYGSLITDKQAEALSLYYDMDLSLAEISEGMGITRQGVRDLIQKGEAHLRKYEQQLGMVKRFDEILKLTVKIKNKSEETGQKEFSDLASQITDILEL